MCLAVPVKILKKIDDDTVLVESRGATLSANIALVKDLAPGDFGLIHAGFIIEKITKESAEELLSFYGELE